MPTILKLKRYVAGAALLVATIGLTGCYYGPRHYAYGPGYGYHQGYYAGGGYGYGNGYSRGGRW
jgi:hypothetical protein